MNLENIAYLELSIIILAVLSMLASVYIIFKTSHKRQKEEVKQDKTEKKEEISWQKKLYSGLKKTKQNLLTSLEAAFKSSQSQEEETLFKKIFETLIMADVGYETSEKITQSLREKSQKLNMNPPSFELIKDLLQEEIRAILSQSASSPEKSLLEKPYVILIVGVNGVGKTTTIGKLAQIYKKQDKSVLIGACDTFRAAATNQLKVWSQRAGAELIEPKTQKADPASVAYESIQIAKDKNCDICLLDTAGRLQTSDDLMNELTKIQKVASKALERPPQETLLVLDATVGQNAIQQALKFKDAVHVTGLILTKLDGTAKGGIAVAIADKLSLPLKFIGVGESIDALHEFDAHEFSKALLEEDEKR